VQLLDHVLLGIKVHGIPYQVKQTFQDLPDVFHGASIKVPDGTSIEDLRKIDGVKVSPYFVFESPGGRADRNLGREQNVWPVRILRRPDGPILEGSGSIDTTAFSASTSRLAKRATTFPPASAYLNDTFTSHVQTGVDKLHNAGILGAGIKVSSLSIS
jgi:hypothetical protein